ncbi:MAG TPA: hypothetical protein VD788_01470 [Candidatus Polarisedimenticolaceae bacterium]|nr:hypothetical protein [Candidatus Polarisedimenticolaceae bacterium]
MRTTVVVTAVLLAGLTAAPLGAQTGIGDEASPWGLRVGLATDPDQVVGGVNFLETPVATNLFIVPNAEIGFGDDAIVLTGTAPVHYRFVVDGSIRPYAGGGVTVGWIDIDLPDNANPNADDDGEFEIAFRGTGGIIWRLNSGTEMFAELNLIAGDLYDAQVMLGWRF